MNITPSHIIEHLYCPRYTYFQYVLCIPQYEHKYYKVQKGRSIHERQKQINKEYLRKKIGVVKKEIEAYLSNDYMRGIVDEVLWLNDGTIAPLDYKYAEYKGIVYETYKTQLQCYAWMIESTYGLKVNRGYLVYTRSNNKLIPLEIPDTQKAKIHQTALSLIEVIDKNRFPKATPYKNRCTKCTFKNICVK